MNFDFKTKFSPCSTYILHGTGGLESDRRILLVSEYQHSLVESLRSILKILKINFYILSNYLQSVTAKLFGLFSLPYMNICSFFSSSSVIIETQVIYSWMTKYSYLGIHRAVSLSLLKSVRSQIPSCLCGTYSIGTVSWNFLLISVLI